MTFEKRIDDVLSNDRNDEDDEIIENDIANNKNIMEDFRSGDFYKAENAESKDPEDIEKLIDDVLLNYENDEDDEITENDLKKNQNLVEDFYARNDEDDGQSK